MNKTIETHDRFLKGGILLDTPTTFLWVDSSSQEVFIQWAGCMYGPAKDLKEVCDGELLSVAKSKLREAMDSDRIAEFVYTDSFGYIDITP